MNGSISKLSRVIGAAALSAALLGSTGCEEAAKECGLACPDQGIKEGNASISGFIAIDTFFQSVVNFKTVANGVAADIQAELDGIRTSFGISNQELAAANGNVGAALKTKLQGTYKASIKIDAQPAKCEIDAHLSAEATVECQAKANCEATPPKVAVDCEGTCTVEASASGTCEGDAEVKCEVSGPEVKCEGECSGSCKATLEAAAKCDGTCTGTCDGSNVTGASCAGMCKGTCEASGMAALDCKGTCNGSCSYKPADAKCTANAKVECEVQGMAKAECTGHCDGDFTPPTVECDASASCEASAKAEAKFQAKCTPPSIDVKITSTATGEAKAQLDFAVADLKVRMPRLLAALKKADTVVEAGTELGAAGKGAISGTIDAFGKGEVGVFAAYRIAQCVPSELTDASDAISMSGGDLAAQVDAAADLTATLGMGG